MLARMFQRCICRGRPWALALGVLGASGVGGLASPAAAASDERLEAAVARHLGLFLARPDRREAGERVVQNQERLEIWFLRPLARSTRDAALCEGLRWLLAGRLDAAAGIKGLFAELPDISEVTLVFYDVETRVEPDAEGRYVQSRSNSPHARFTVSRARAALLEPAAIKQTLAGTECRRAGEPLIDLLWVR